MELTVLGASGSYGSRHGACSGYLVRTREANLWLDCGNGTLANLHEHLDPADLDVLGYPRDEILAALDAAHDHAGVRDRPAGDQALQGHRPRHADQLALRPRVL